MTESDAKLSHRHERFEFLNAIAHKCTRQGRFDAAMLHLDHPIPGTDLYLVASDHGTGAATIRAGAQNADPTPHWLKAWNNAYSTLPPRGKKVLNALMVDWRSRPAAKIAGVTHPTVNHWKRIFKVHFATCFNAYKRDSTQ